MLIINLIAILRIESRNYKFVMFRSKLCVFIFFIVNVFIYAQQDTFPSNAVVNPLVVQFHVIAKDLNVVFEHDDEMISAFQNNNLSAGLYLKKGMYELFFALPTIVFRNRVVGEAKTFGSLVGLNVYPGKLHFNYNFKYLQGYESIDQVRVDRLQTVANFNSFFFNRLNTHYVFNNEAFSLRAALRYIDRQKESAGSWIIAAPVSFHFGKVDEIFNTTNFDFSRLSIGAMGGYGYNYVVKDWMLSAILKGGVDVRKSTVIGDSRIALFPSVNIVSSVNYDRNDYFIGVSFYYYPEFETSYDYNMQLQNWNIRFYLGYRFL